MRYLSLAGVLVAAGAGYLTLAPTKGEDQAAVCTVLVDRTHSSVDPRVKASYIEAAKEAVAGCDDANANLTVFFFDNGGERLQKPPGKQPFELYRPQTRRESLGDEKVAEAIAAANDAVETVFEVGVTKGGHGSDIATALRSAAEDLQAQANKDDVDNRYLVVLTDGYQTGEDLGVKHAFRHENDKIEPMLKTAQRLGLVPALSGVQVSFVGAGGGVVEGRDEKPLWFESKVRQFWTQLVEMGGGQMCVYNIKSTSLPGHC